MDKNLTFFGKMDYEAFDAMNDLEKEKYLLDEGWYCWIRNSNSKAERYFRPTNELIEQYYAFLLGEIKFDIDKKVSEYFAKLNDELYGLTSKKTRNKALEQFNKIYYRLNPKGLTFTDKKESQNGIEITESRSRTFVLSGLKSAKMHNIAENDALMAYLSGAKEYMVKRGYFKSLSIKKITEFESDLRILLQLNEQHGFEKDRYFTKAYKYSQLYKTKYDRLFISVEIFAAVCDLIENNQSNISSFNDSLYEVLSSEEMVKGTKEKYLKFLKTEFNSTKSDIKIYKPLENLEHDKRIKEIIEYFADL